MESQLKKKLKKLLLSKDLHLNSLKEMIAESHLKSSQQLELLQMETNPSSTRFSQHTQAGLTKEMN